MKILSWLRKRTWAPDDDRWYQPSWYGMPTTSGTYVDANSALAIPTLYACVRLISETIAGLPIDVFRKTPDGREDDDEHELNALFMRPNRWQTKFEFFETMTANVLLRGNAYAKILPAGNSPFGELIPLNPDRVRVERANEMGLNVYRYSPEKGPAETLLANEVLHIPGLSFDGMKGLSPIEYHRETLGMALAGTDYAARFFKNDARPSVVLKHPGKLTPEGAQRLKDSWQRAQSGPNRHSVAVIEEGMDAQIVSISPADARYIETAGMTNHDIMRVFRVPPPKVGYLERATWANIEQLNIQFVQDAVLPWVMRWEQRAQRSLMTEETARDHYVKFNLAGLLRGDLQSRFSAYQIGFTNGWLSPNDIRRLEDMNPIPDGDDYYRPANLSPLDAPAPLAGSGGGVPPVPGQAPKERVLSIVQEAQRAVGSD